MLCPGVGFGCLLERGAPCSGHFSASGDGVQSYRRFCGGVHVHLQPSRCCGDLFHPNTLKEVNITWCLLLVGFFSLIADFEINFSIYAKLKNKL